MTPITGQTYQRAIDIIVKSYASNPSILWVVKNDRYFENRLYELAKFCIDTGMQKNGAFISEDGKGVTVFYSNQAKLPFWFGVKAYVRMAVKCITLPRVPAILYREWKTAKIRPNSPHLYFVILGIDGKRDGMKTVVEMKEHAYQLSADLNLPIYAETTIEKNKRVYERYGFETYQTWHVKSQRLDLWFLRRFPQ